MATIITEQDLHRQALEQAAALGLVNPIGIAKHQLGAAPRLAKLQGARGGLLDNTKGNAGPLLTHVGNLLRDRYGVKEVSIHRKLVYSRPADPALLDLLAKNYDFVVTGVGVELPVSNDQLPAISGPLPASYFVYAGRKEVGKNVPLLCQWFTNYVERFHLNTKLVFIGGGDQALIPASDQFIDLGFVSEAMKHHVVRHSQGVINLSENESFSIVIMEGWLLGAPAVVSAGCAVTKDHVRKCNGGLYVSTSDEFALALRYLEEHADARNLLAANGQKYVTREFSFDAVLARYLRQFRGFEQVCLAAVPA